MQQFTEVTIEWTQSTFIFYLAIILGCYLIAVMVRNTNIRLVIRERYPANLFLITIILLFVKCFNTTGADVRGGYAFNFSLATSMAAYYDKTVEIGWQFLMVVINNLTGNYFVFLFVVGLLTVFPVIHFIYKYRKKINVPAAVILYTGIYFINSFSACRQYLSVSLSLFAFDAIIEKKSLKALFWIAVSSLFHVSCLLLIIPYFLSFFRQLSKKMIAFSAILFLALFYLSRGSIASLLADHDRYKIYFISDEVHFGFEQIVYYTPLFFLLYLCRKDRANRYFSRVVYIYLVTGFLFGMCSYILPIFGRLQPVFMPIIIFIPYYIKWYKDHHYSKTKKTLLNMVVVFYAAARFVIWIVQYYNGEDLMPYTNMFGKII